MAIVTKLNRAGSGNWTWFAPSGRKYRIVKREWCAPSAGVSYDLIREFDPVRKPNTEKRIATEDRLTDIREWWLSGWENDEW